MKNIPFLILGLGATLALAFCSCSKKADAQNELNKAATVLEATEAAPSPEAKRPELRPAQLPRFQIQSK